MKNDTKSLAVGVDIGGTNIKMGLVTDQGQVIDHLSFPLTRSNGHTADVSSICHSIGHFIEKHQVKNQIAGVGVASPGILDANSGVVHYAVNLGWENINLTEILQNTLQLPVRLESDAAAGAMGERCYGAGAEMSSFLYVCIGTGVGASLLINNQFYQGDLGSAINIGHISVIPDGIPCECGNLGCLEKYVSGPAIMQRVQQESHKVDTLLHQYMNEEQRITPLLVYHAAKNGDIYARQVYEEAGHLLGISLVNCLHLFGVGNIIVGGGLSLAGAYLLDSAKSTVAERFSKQNLFKINIVNAAFPTLSGVLGAAASILNTHVKVV